MQRGLYARFVRDFIFMPAESVTQGEGADSRGEGSPLDDIAQAADTAQAMLPNEVSDNGVVGKMQSVSCQGTLDPLNGLGVEKMATSVAAVSAVLRLVENSSLKGQPPQSIPEQHTCEQDLAEISAVRGAVLAAEEGAVGSVSPRSGTSGSSRCRSHMIGELKPTDDDPLSNKESSEWAALWSDKELMHAIEQDVVRTMPDLAFYACRSMEDDDGDGNGNSQGEEGDNGDRKKVRLERRKLGQERRLAISRILFVHAKLNPAESYTQGMNEIVATLFFVLASDDNEEWRQHCEADTFFCFTNLMAEIRDVFIQSLDESESGLHGKMQAFSTTLRQHDPELADHIVRKRFKAFTLSCLNYNSSADVLVCVIFSLLLLKKKIFTHCRHHFFLRVSTDGQHTHELSVQYSTFDFFERRWQGYGRRCFTAVRTMVCTYVRTATRSRIALLRSP